MYQMDLRRSDRAWILSSRSSTLTMREGMAKGPDPRHIWQELTSVPIPLVPAWTSRSEMLFRSRRGDRQWACTCCIHCGARRPQDSVEGSSAQLVSDFYE